MGQYMLTNGIQGTQRVQWKSGYKTLFFNGLWLESIYVFPKRGLLGILEHKTEALRLGREPRQVKRA